MSDPDDAPAHPAELPESLLDEIDSLDPTELRALGSYVDRQIASARKPLAAAIEADSGGEVIEIEDHGAYALVRQHPPNSDGPGVNRDLVELYHVRREPDLDGDEHLHWAFVGEMGETDATATSPCPSCGEPVAEASTVCPHCGTELSDKPNGDH